MSLARMINKKKIVVLGLNSGTSADGLDMAAVKFDLKKKNLKITYLTSKKKLYTPELKKFIIMISGAKKLDLEELIYLDNILGKFYGQKAKAFIKELANKNIVIDLIASHGQTVRHLPDKVKRLTYNINGTFQIGSPDFIAAATGKVVISDFRQADIALGNEGAPITVGAMYELFSSNSEPRLFVNIGGIANYFYFPVQGSKFSVKAADCGPGNCLCDTLANKLFKEMFDKNGKHALKGNISERLLLLLLTNPFFSGKNISTGRESFGFDIVSIIIDFGKKFNLSKEDLMATTAELTARTIALKVRRFIQKDKKLSKLYLTGGGRNNIFFVERIKYHLPGIEVCMADELGINADYIEAVSFAVMGEACLHSKPLTSTGRKNKIKSDIALPILGKVTQPPVTGSSKYTGKLF
ncbi:MAG: anhydro-N-acetylmuramic acid kinase [Candidatus Zixiibacteriota bacterium]